jgi:hypothetical protein
MGFRDSWAQWALFVLVAAVTVLALVFLLPFHREPPHQGSYTFTELVFLPRSGFLLPESESELNETILDELMNSNITLTVEIEGTSAHWVQNYTVIEWEDMPYFEWEGRCATIMRFTEWEYGREYTYTIELRCSSEDEAVRSLPIFDQDLYFQGSFSISRGRMDKVKFSEDERLYKRYTGQVYVLYYGEVNERGVLEDDVFFVNLDKRGVATSA